MDEEKTTQPAHGEPGHDCELHSQGARAKWVEHMVLHANKADAIETFERIRQHPIASAEIPNGFGNVPDRLKGLTGAMIARLYHENPVPVSVTPFEMALTLALAAAEAGYRLGFEDALGKRA